MSKWYYPIKSILYRISGIFISWIITYLLTNNVEISFTVAIIDSAVKFVWYMVYDKLWERKKRKV